MEPRTDKRIDRQTDRQKERKDEQKIKTDKLINWRKTERKTHDSKKPTK